MNKYQEALDFLQEECRTIKKGEAKQHIKTLQELVDKATPKKQTRDGDYFSFGHCPTCKKIIPIQSKYCPNCGQHILFED